MMRLEIETPDMLLKGITFVHSITEIRKKVFYLNELFSNNYDGDELKR